MGICYIVASGGDKGGLSRKFGHPPLCKEGTATSPDYGPLDRFCHIAHAGFESWSGSYIEHPSWRKDSLGGLRYHWGELLAEIPDYRDDPVVFTSAEKDR